MPIRLAENRYGKSQVRLVTVARGTDRHELKDVTVDIRLTGDFEAAHRDGDNSRVYPTDSMKNSVYILARRHGIDAIEEFARRLARHLLERESAPSEVDVRVAERLWNRIPIGDGPHPHAFVAGAGERRTARVEASAAAERVEAGLEDLVVLKTTGSGFAGFPRDETTTLAETSDRILATAIDATWRYTAPVASYSATWQAVRGLLLETFAEHDSLSVQHTLWAMGERVLESVAEIAEISLRLPNRHHLRADLAPFGLDNPNLVFVATSEPYGVIEATLTRS
ncbi:MAG TPA: urate oxidase [Thermoanaerobaculia bacterium]|nr:urate oxidase [Thermoanaerobaculia bacterium]